MWDGQEKDHLQRVRQGRLDGRKVVLEDELRERGQGDRPDGDAEEAERQVHDPEGVSEPADAPLGQRRDQDRVDEDVDARPREPDRDGDEQGHDPKELGVTKVQDGTPAETLAPEERQLDEKLHQPADEDADGQAEDGILAVGDVPAVGQDREKDGKEVEDRRGHGWDEERSLRIEVAHGPGGQADEQEEGEEDRRQLSGQAIFPGTLPKPKAIHLAR